MATLGEGFSRTIPCRFTGRRSPGTFSALAALAMAVVAASMSFAGAEASASQGSDTGDEQLQAQSNSVTLPFKGSLTRVPPARKLLARDDKPLPGASVVLIGGLIAECTTAKEPSGIVTACGTAVTPPAQGKTSQVKGQTYCNSAPKTRSASLTTTAQLPPGLYVHVIDGLILLSNPGGQQSFSAGQFGYTPSSVLPPPVVVPKNPGIQFAPPPVFDPATQPSANGSGPKPIAVNCEVRSLARSSHRSRAASLASTAQGSIVFFSAGGLRPSSAVSAYLLSAPNAALGEFEADESGNLAAWVRIPATSALGPDVLQVNGYIPEGYSASLNTGIEVRAAVRTKVKKPVYFGSMSSDLTRSALKSLDVTRARIPVGSPARCVVTPVVRDGVVEPALVDLAMARAEVTADYLGAHGLACRVSAVPAVTHGSTYRARRANVTIAYYR